MKQLTLYTSIILHLVTFIKDIFKVTILFTSDAVCQILIVAIIEDKDFPSYFSIISERLMKFEKMVTMFAPTFLYNYFSTLKSVENLRCYISGYNQSSGERKIERFSFIENSSRKTINVDCYTKTFKFVPPICTTFS